MLGAMSNARGAVQWDFGSFPEKSAPSGGTTRPARRPAEKVSADPGHGEAEHEEAPA